MKQLGVTAYTGSEMDEFLAVPEEELKVEVPIVAKSIAPRILVVDDDPLFRARIRRVAERRSIPVTVCGSLDELDSMLDSRLFDIAVVDYYLDEMRTQLKGTNVAEVMEGTPTILISSTDHGIENYSAFPNSIRKFLNKRVGINAILDTAVKLANSTP